MHSRLPYVAPRHRSPIGSRRLRVACPPAPSLWCFQRRGLFFCAHEGDALAPPGTRVASGVTDFIRSRIKSVTSGALRPLDLRPPPTGMEIDSQENVILRLELVRLVC